MPLSSPETPLSPVTFPPGREARHEPGLDRVVAERHHNRDRASLSSDRCDRRIGGHHDHVRLEPDELARELRESLGPSLAIADFEDERVALDMAELA